MNTTVSPAGTSTSGPSDASAFIGEIVADRLEAVILQSSDSRVLYAMVDLGNDLSCAIADCVSRLSVADGGRIHVAVHPDLATRWLSRRLVSDNAPTRYRNQKNEGVVATLFSIPGRQLEQALQSLGSVQRINHTWILDPEKAGLWADCTLPRYTNIKISAKLTRLLRGLMESGILTSAMMLAEFCLSIRKTVTGKPKPKLWKSVSYAFPTLQLPRDCIAENAISSLMKSPASGFCRLRDSFRPCLHLRDRKGGHRVRQDMRTTLKRLTKNQEVSETNADILEDLVRDKSIRYGRWRPSQRRVAEVSWPEIRRFFNEKKVNQTTLGERTIKFLDDECPKALKQDDREVLGTLKDTSAESTPQLRNIYFTHRKHFRDKPILYKQWNALLFNKPLECKDDLLQGLVRLVGRAVSTVDDVQKYEIVVRLRNGERRSFWTKQKNVDLCGLLRDRYRGVAEILSDQLTLDFGLCWKGSWEDSEGTSGKSGRKENKGAGRSREFEFEAYLVPLSSSEKSTAKADKSNNNQEDLGSPAAQLTWKPNPKGFGAALPYDLRRVKTSGQEPAHLLRSHLPAPQGSSGSNVARPDLAQVISVTDSFGGSDGALANPTDDQNCISKWWPETLRKYSQGVLSAEQLGEGFRLFARFRDAYSAALASMTMPDGRGLADSSLVDQVREYGTLLTWLRRHARSDELVRKVWAPLLEIGTATIKGSMPSMIVTPWHPLRLLELTAKAHQAGALLKRVLASSASEAVGVEDYINDRVRSFKDTYYANTNTAVNRMASGARLLSETDQVLGYSLLQPVSSDRDLGRASRMVEKPVKEAVRKVGQIASHYLKLNPHDRSNFSVVLFDTESDDLAVAMAKHLAKKVQKQADLRCDLTITHSDSGKLHRIYEHQNRRIGRELESSLTSEAARTFLSRLRIGITSKPSEHRVHQYDLLLLHDVMGPHAKVVWHLVQGWADGIDSLQHSPNDTSRRKSLTHGSLSTSVFLTAPIQARCTQPYLDVMHDVQEGKPSSAAEHWIPAQEVEFASETVRRTLEQAHRLARWVVTYDRIVDRRVIGSDDGQLRILRYFSTPRSRYNVIVSTQMSRQELRSRLEEDVRRLRVCRDSVECKEIVQAIHERTTGLCGGILMRGSLWDNYALELIGVVVAQRELELLLRDQAEHGDHQTAMFFLDEIRNWLEIKGRLADILAVDLRSEGSGKGSIHLVVAEAKCVRRAAVRKSRKVSWEQLEETYTAIVNRFVDEKGIVDRTIWFKRLADLLVEHMAPWPEQYRLGGWSFEEWIDRIRMCEVAVDVTAHSVITVHDTAHPRNDLDLRTADGSKDRGNRRRLAQWTLGADLMVRSIRGIVKDDKGCLLHMPRAWPSTILDSDSSDPGRESSEVADAEISAEGSPTNESRVGEYGTKTDHQVPVRKRRAHQGTPAGWQPEVFEALASIGSGADGEKGQAWLQDQATRLRMALQDEQFDAPVEATRLTPNAGLIRIDGKAVDIRWLVKHQVDRLLVRHSIEIARIAPKPGHVVVAVKRRERAILHLADTWNRRTLGPGGSTPNLAPVIGEREDDGELFYLPLAGGIGGQPQAAPHTLVSGTTGSGKGILAANLILDICAFNDPRSVQVCLIDPKFGADYLWAQDLPHLRQSIVSECDAAVDLLESLVTTMEQRYKRITKARCQNIVEFNRKCGHAKQLPYIIILFDEVANWMQDKFFKKRVESVLNSIATKARAAGLHLIMIYQRADNQVMTMQLRNNLGNRLILKLGDEGSSKIALGAKGAESLMGKGHIIADVGTGRFHGQVPFINSEDAQILADAIRRAWSLDST